MWAAACSGRNEQWEAPTRWFYHYFLPETLSYNIQWQSGWLLKVPMPSPSLGTFNPTHFFHPLLGATHSIESEEDFFLGRRTLGTNCPGKRLRIVLVNQALEFSVFPPLTRKLPGLAHRCYIFLAGLKLQHRSLVGAKELGLGTMYSSSVCFPLLLWVYERPQSSPLSVRWFSGSR